MKKPKIKEIYQEYRSFDGSWVIAPLELVYLIIFLYRILILSPIYIIWYLFMQL